MKAEEEEEEVEKYDKGLENISNKIINENFPKQKKVPVNVKEASKIPKRVRKIPFAT